MKKMKMAFAALLCIAIVLSSTPFALAAGADTFVQTDQYIYRLNADNVTNDLTNDLAAAKFGASDGAANGRVWTDKSVTTASDGFDVTLSAMAQEYLSYNGDYYTSSQAVDALLILDFTESMETSFDGSNRIRCLCDAANRAIQTIMDANPKNRVLVVEYSSSSDKPQYDTVLPLGHYQNTSWTSTDYFASKLTRLSNVALNSLAANKNNKGDKQFYDGKYLTYFIFTTSGYSSTQKQYVSTNPAIEMSSSANGSYTAFPEKTIWLTGKTDMQDGIIYGCQELVSAIGSTTYDEERAPFVLFLTDGAANLATKEKSFSNTPTAMNTNCGLTDTVSGTTDSTKTPLVAAYTILTAAFQKTQIKAAYDAYNKKHNGTKEDSFGVHWYNVGVAVKNSSDIKAILSPSTAFSVTKVKNEITSTCNAYPNPGSSFNSSAAVSFCDEENVTYATSQSTLKGALDRMAQAVSEFSKTKLVPITNVEGNAASTQIVFTDVLGDNLMVESFNLTLGGKSYTGIPNAAKTKFTFEGLDTTAELSKNADNRVVVTWTLPGYEVDMYTLSNKKELETSPTGPFYYNTATPTRLTFRAKIDKGSTKSPLTTGAVTGSEAQSYVQYYVPSDNPYYYNPVYNYSAAPISLISTSLKNTADMKARDDFNKAENVSGTSAYINSCSYAEVAGNDGNICRVTNKLGNNGKAVFTGLRVTKTVDKSQIKVTGKVTYTVTVENLGTDSHSGISLTDVIPDKFTYVDGSATKTNTADSIAVSGKGVSMNVASLPGSSSTVLTYQVKNSSGAKDDVISSVIPRITGFDGLVINDDNKDGEVGPSVKIVDSVPVSLRYSWTGAPSTVTIPADVKDKAEGTAYSANTEFSSGKTVTDSGKKYVFSGWSLKGADSGNSYAATGTFGEEDILATGSWTAENQKTVSFDWGTYTPTAAGYTLPADITGFTGDTYTTADKTIGGNNTITLKDAYGNDCYSYTFKGWSDPQSGVIGTADSTVTAIWEGKSIDNPTHSVTYSWTNAPASESGKLPATASYYNNQNYTVDSTYTNGSRVTDTKSGKEVGYWEFGGWKKDGTVVTGQQTMGTSDVTLNGVWTYHEKITLTYDWGTFTPSGKDLPDPVSGYQGDTYTAPTGLTVGDVFPVYDSANPDVIVKYVTFNGWDDPNGGVIPAASGTIVAKWTETAADKYAVTYSWSNAPAAAGSSPAAAEYFEKQKYTVDAAYKAGDFVKDTDGTGKEIGKWVFSGWKKDGSVVTGEQTMGNGAVALTGEWTYTAKQTVSFSFDGNQPTSAVLPEAMSVYPGEALVIGNTYGDTTEDVGGVRYEYHFNGWTLAGGATVPTVVPNDAVTVVGNWTKTVAAKYTVSYTWNLPTDATSTLSDSDLPTAINNYAGEAYTVDTKVNDSTKVEKRATNNGVEGYYEFNGWDDPNSGKVPANNDSVIKATWKWAPNDKVKVPVQSDKKPEGFVITNPEDYPEAEYIFTDPVPVDTQFPVYDPNDRKVIIGYDIYKGFEDPNDGDIPEKGTDPKDIVIKWDYQEATKYTVNYNWNLPDDATGTVAEVLPEKITDYTNAKYTVDTTVTSATKVEKRAADNGVEGYYEFNGWNDPNSGKVPANNNSVINATWKWAPNNKVIVPVQSDKNPEGFSYTKPENYPEGKYTFENPVPVNTEFPVYDPNDSTVIIGYDIYRGFEDPNGGVIPEKGTNPETIVIHWDFREPVKYNVNYDWNLPEDATGTVKTTKPNAISGFANAQYAVDTTVNITTKVEKKTADGGLVGYYVFNGWDDSENNGRIPDNNITSIKAKWLFSDADVCTVKYSWNNAPDAVKDSLPATKDYYQGQKYTVDTTFTKASTVPVTNAGKEVGRYEFSGWKLNSADAAGEKVAGEEDVTFTGEWTYNPKYELNYAFGTVAPTAANLPDSVLLYAGEAITLANGYSDMVQEEGGLRYLYHFNGWDTTAPAVMPAEAVTVTGSWTKSDVTTYTVSYVWNLPADATSTLSDSDLPAAINNYAGEAYTVDTKVDDSTKVEKRATNNGVEGYYEFNGWDDPNSGKVPANNDSQIKATWKWAPNSKVEVPVKSDKNPEGFEIPEIKDYPEAEYTFTDPVPVDTEFPVYDPNDPEVIIGYDIYKGFEDPNDGDIPEKGTDPKDIVIKWEYKEATKYTVNYNWNLPADATGTVAEVLPEKITDYTNAKYTVDTAITSTTKVEKRAANKGVEGYYEFNGWDDPNSGKVPANNDSQIKATWTWAPNSKVEVPVKSDKNPEGFEIPEIKDYPEAEYTFTDPVPVDTRFPVYDPNDTEVIIGYDIYKGFEDPNDGDIPEKGTDPKDIVIKWDYKDADKYGIVYSWGEHTPEGTSLPVDNETYYENAKFTVDKTVTDATVVFDDDAFGNHKTKHTFDGWDTEDGRMPADNVTITAKWKSEELTVPTYPVTYKNSDSENPDGKEIIVNGDKIKVDPNGGIWTYTGIDYTYPLVIPVTRAITISDPKRDGYNFVGWEKVEDSEYGLCLRAVWVEKTHTEKMIDFINGIDLPAFEWPDFTLPEIDFSGLEKLFDKVTDNKEEKQDDSDIPYTGSKSVDWVWFALCASAGIGTCALLLGKKKEEDEE